MLCAVLNTVHKYTINTVCKLLLLSAALLEQDAMVCLYAYLKPFFPL
jgi:hypothetical protein